jgi:hypothetical protein
LRGPSHAALEVVAKEVESSWHSRIHDPGFLRLKPQSIGLREALDSPQGLVGLLLLAGDYNKLRLRIAQIVN